MIEFVTKHILDKWFSKAERIVIIGVGNPLRMDDGVGIEIIKRLENKVSKYVYLIDSETIPEDYIEPISDFKPTHILLIDAGLLDVEPGMIRLVEDLNVSRLSVSTHALPIQVLCAYLLRTTHAKIAMLLIQPKEADFGEGLSRELKKTADMIASYLLSFPIIGKR
jgi:hydrogenase 3 maturation protease